MKKSLATIAFATLGAGSLFAQGGIPGLSLSGKVGFESEYISRGKEHSDSNIQTTIYTEYNLPTGGIAASIYGGVFAMTPIQQTGNQVDWNLGAKGDYDMFTFDAGWLLHTYPNNDDAVAWEMNRFPYNRTNEIYIGAAANLEWAKPAFYVYYDFNLEQVTYEVSIARTIEGVDFGVPDFALTLKAFAGYLSANQYNSDQVDLPPNIPGFTDSDGNWKNGYAYAGFSADLIYHATPNADIGLGIRYAWNNDGTADDAPWMASNTDSNFWWGAWVNFRY